MDKNRSSVEFTGTVYDIDYSQERTQVLIRGAGNAPGMSELTGFVTSDEIQDVLQTSLISKRPVRVTHYTGNIIRVVLIPTPTVCSADGCVTEVDCTASECTAVIVGEPNRVNVKDRRTLGVLLTAVNDDLRVENLAVDQQHNITQVKVNVERRA